MSCLCHSTSSLVWVPGLLSCRTYGPAFFNNDRMMCLGAHVITLPEMTPSPHECDSPYCGFYASYKNVTWPAVHLRLNHERLHWSLMERWLSVFKLSWEKIYPAYGIFALDIRVIFVKEKKFKFNLKLLLYVVTLYKLLSPLVWWEYGN